MADLDREPFLRAIYAAPADDLPRLAFADWLDEHGGEADRRRAELIRVQCELAPLVPGFDDPARAAGLAAREAVLLAEVDPSGKRGEFRRGFRDIDRIEATAAQLGDPDGFRAAACRHHPEWYGATRLKVVAGPVVFAEPLATALTSPVTERVTELDLSGVEEAVPAADDDAVARELGITFADFVCRPLLNTAMVEALAGMRECRRLTVLDLRFNDLGNDALRALARSNYFTRLTTLRLSDGNRFRGAVWAQVRERFGEDVVE